jgi:hypothetical protein
MHQKLCDKTLVQSRLALLYHRRWPAHADAPCVRKQPPFRTLKKAVSDQQNGNEDDFKCEVELGFATLEFERKREEIPIIALNAKSGDH